jgi:hypothetical protein
MPNITNITPPRVPLMDPRNGLISREWYLFFLSLFNQTGGSAVSLEDVQKGPPTQDLDINALLAQASLNAESSSALLSQYAALSNDVQALALGSADTPLLSQYAALSNDVQALALGPADTPQLPRLRYGSFYDTTDQTAAVINTAYGMTFNSTDITKGVTIGTPTSRVYVDTRSVYNIQFSAQFVNTAGGTHNVWVWLRKNGTDVANSTTTLRLQGNNAETVAAWNFLLDMNAGDYFELMWEVSDLAVALLADPASAVHPAIPSIILTVTDNISS